MAIHKRTELESLLTAIAQTGPKQVYLCFGERYLCQRAADQIERSILKQRQGAVYAIDGHTEESDKLLSRLLTFSLLPGIQLYRVTDTRLFLSRTVCSDIWDKAVQAFQENKIERARKQLGSLMNIAAITADTANAFSAIAPDQWQKLFGFSHPGGDLSWADRLAGEMDPGKTGTAVDAGAEKLGQVIEQGFPPDNILILTTENVDKRKKLFTRIKAHGEIIDCSVAGGTSRAARNEQKEVVREMARRTLAEFNKTMDQKAFELLFERVGFYPVAIVSEVEKLALYSDERSRITIEDLDTMVARTREDAVFELTEALGNRDIRRSLIILNHLLIDGVHYLAILASLRNFFRKLLIFRCLQAADTPRWRKGINASEFQNSYLPVLKERGEWADLLKGHPYALFMSFKKARDFSPDGLKHTLSLLLAAEYRLKGTPIPPVIVLEELLLSVIRGTRRK